MGVAYSAHTIYTRSQKRLKQDGASCQLSYSITEDSNSHDSFGAVRPWSRRDWACTLRVFSCGATLFAPRRDAYLQSI